MWPLLPVALGGVLLLALGAAELAPVHSAKTPPQRPPQAPRGTASRAAGGCKGSSPEGCDPDTCTSVYGWPPGADFGDDKVYLGCLQGQHMALESISYGHPPGNPNEIWMFPNSLLPEGWVATSRQSSSSDVLTVETPPEEVMDAFIDQLAAQSKGIAAKQMASMARRMLTVHEPGFSAIVIPTDQRLSRFLPSQDLLDRVASALSGSYEVEYILIPAKWTDATLGEVELSGIAFYPRGGDVPNVDDVFGPIRETLRQYIGRGEFVFGGSGGDESYGNILNLIIQTFIAAAVGTIGSMAGQDLYHAAGGERRLSRLVRKYKRASPQRGRRLIAKIKRTAERLKGRSVDWNEVESLIADYDAKHPGV